MGVEAVTGGRVVWHCEWEDAPSAILKHHWPDVPNFKDVSKVDWASIAPVDILTGGFPCQDVSLAGARKGLAEGTRSGLWSEFAKAIDVIRPRLVVIENVRGLLSASAGSDVEPCPWCLGDESDQPSLRALGAVCGELSELGYDSQWTTVRASDAGACHRRERVFIVAWPECSDSGSVGQLLVKHGEDTFRDSGQSQPFASRVEQEYDDLADLPESSMLRTPSAIEGEGGAIRADVAREKNRMLMVRDQMAQLAADNGLKVSASLLPTPTTQDGKNNGAPSQMERNTLPLNAEVMLLPTPNTMEHREIKSAEQIAEMKAKSPGGYRNLREEVINEVQNWGQYEPAIRRWEQVIGRPAPAPTLPDGKEGAHRLSPFFVEWMMGLNEGHVTATEIGISRNEMLKACGNGVVPQQAELAVRYLLGAI
jgi:DNA (cytosine-5)-methyltransferase 1